MKVRQSVAIKIFFAILGILLCMLLIIIVFMERIYKEELEEKEIEYHVQLTNTTTDQFNILVNMLTESMEIVKEHEQVLKAVVNEESVQVEELLKEIESINYNINDVHVLGINGKLYSTNADIEQTGEDNFYKEYYEEYQNSESRTEVWTELHTTRDDQYLSSVSYIEPIFIEEDFAGIVAIDVSYESIHKIFTDSSIRNNDRSAIIDQNGEIIVQFPLTTSFSSILEKYPEVVSGDSMFEDVLYKKEVIVVSEELGVPEWRVVRIILKEDIARGFQDIFDNFNLLVIVVILVSILFTGLFVRYIAKTLRKLTEACNRIKQGDYTAHIDIKSEDEFGQLGKTFNSMVTQINQHFEDEKKAQIRKAEMEYEILQAQINPHFLYNTLDSIKWLAIMQGVENIGEMSVALINLLKYNLGKGRSRITLKDEVESVKNYITIQKYRYTDMFEFSLNIQEEAYQCEVIRFILQPLVENCIIHGFKEEKLNYRIHIGATVVDECLVIKVIDNGKGMEEQCKDKLNKGVIGKDRLNHIGVNNIRERIQLHFGKEYGLKFDSKSDVATIAEITLPYVEKSNRE